MNRRPRVAVLLILVGLQCILLVWFGGVGFGGSPYPGGEELAADGQAHVGQQVVVYGQVAETNPLTLRYDDDGRTVEFRVTEVDHAIERGEYLEVYGIVRSKRVVAATGTVRYPERGHWYAYGISVVAALLTGSRLLRHWRISWETLALEPRRDA